MALLYPTTALVMALPIPLPAFVKPAIAQPLLYFGAESSGTDRVSVADVVEPTGAFPEYVVQYTVKVPLWELGIAGPHVAADGVNDNDVAVVIVATGPE